MSKSLLLVTFVGAFILAGCSQNLARFSVASTGNLPVKFDKGDYVTGKDCITKILWFGLGNTQNRVSGAVGKALEQASKKGIHAEGLTNVDISSSYWSLLLFGRQCITAKGQPILVK